MSTLNEQEGFALSDLQLVCRWRLHEGALPLANRHIRALAARRKACGVVTPEMCAWVKQHIEWTLSRQSAPYEDGVLMLLVDRDGKAAMAAAPYEPIDPKPREVMRRVRDSVTEAAETGVAPDTIAALKDGTLILGMPSSQYPSGSVSFIKQLAETLGIVVTYDEDLPVTALAGGHDALMLISDEHGVVGVGSSAKKASVKRFTGAYETICKKTADKAR